VLSVFQHFDGKLQLVGVRLLFCHHHNAQGSKRSEVERIRETELADKKRRSSTSLKGRVSKT
jgi:hypothetical protein